MDSFYLYTILFLTGLIIFLISSYLPKTNDPQENNRIWIFLLGFFLVMFSAFGMYYKELS